MTLVSLDSLKKVTDAVGEQPGRKLLIWIGGNHPTGVTRSVKKEAERHQVASK